MSETAHSRPVSPSPSHGSDVKSVTSEHEVASGLELADEGAEDSGSDSGSESETEAEAEVEAEPGAADASTATEGTATTKAVKWTWTEEDKPIMENQSLMSKTTLMEYSMDDIEAVKQAMELAYAIQEHSDFDPKWVKICMTKTKELSTGTEDSSAIYTRRNNFRNAFKIDMVTLCPGQTYPTGTLSSFYFATKETYEPPATAVDPAASTTADETSAEGGGGTATIVDLMQGVDIESCPVEGSDDGEGLAAEAEESGAVPEGSDKEEAE